MFQNLTICTTNCSVKDSRSPTKPAPEKAPYSFPRETDQTKHFASSPSTAIYYRLASSCPQLRKSGSVAPGCLRRSSAAAVWSFFERGTILLGRGPRMPWPRLLDRIADRNKRVPATLIVHGCEPMEFGEPARNFRPRPQAAIIRRRLDPLLKRSQRLGRQDRRLRAVADALVAKRRGSALVVALDQRPHPPRRERQQFRHLLNLISRGQKPQRMKVALADRIGRPLIARLKLNAAQSPIDRRQDRARGAES